MFAPCRLGAIFPIISGIIPVGIPWFGIPPKFWFITASPDTTPKFLPPETSCPPRPVAPILGKPPARLISCLAPHSGQNMLSCGISSVQEPHCILSPR